MRASLAAAAGAGIAIEAIASAHARGPAPLNAAVCLSLAVPLALGSRAPLTAAAAVGVIATVQTALLTPLPPLVTPLVLALVPAYVVGASGGRPLRALAGLAICLVGAAAIELAAPASARDLGGLAPSVAIIVVSLGAGRFVAAMGGRIRELERLEARLIELRPARRRLAIADERAHVARELHDVVAHSMTVICLQAGAAQRVWWDHPEQAARAVESVGAAARDTLGHLRGVLGLLDPVEPHRQLGLADVESLAEHARDAGLNVAVDVQGRTRAVPGQIGLVAYRIVQEALTNAIRHAAPTDVAVRLAYEPAALAIEVSDVGRRPGSRELVSLAGSGHGLRGMRERVERHEGTLSFGPLDSGGFAVAARLPLEEGP